MRIVRCLIEWRDETISCGNRELLERVESGKVFYCENCKVFD